MDVVVFGAGSLGSLIGGLLADDHDVTLVGRAPHVDAVREDGLRITGLVERSVRPDAVTELDAESTSADLAVVTVKAYDTGAAAVGLAGCDLGAVLSLQNGMGNEETLADHLDCPVLAGTTDFGARYREPGVVECTGVGSVTLGPRPGEEGEPARGVGDAFDASGIEARVEPDMRPSLWEKLAVNAGINPVTALARVENGALLDGPAGEVATAAAVEVAGVARSRGIDLDDAAARETVRRVAAATARNRSSMLQDVETGRRTEIDAIAGYVVERAEEPVPVNATLAALLRGWEAGRGLE